MKKLNELLGTRLPIIQGGMANIATGEFAAACSNAGALGIVASGGVRSAQELPEQIARCRALTDRPFGVNIMLMHPCADELAQVVIDERVPVVTTGAGNPGKYVPGWKDAGVTVIPVVAAAVLAQRLMRYGVDAIIAEGTESGGHVGEMTTMALVPQVIDAVDVPVIAAGGSLPRRLRSARAARRWAPACWQARNARFTRTTSRRCCAQGTATPSSPGAAWAGPCACSKTGCRANMCVRSSRARRSPIWKG